MDNKERLVSLIYVGFGAVMLGMTFLLIGSTFSRMDNYQGGSSELGLLKTMLQGALVFASIVLTLEGYRALAGSIERPYPKRPFVKEKSAATVAAKQEAAPAAKFQPKAEQRSPEVVAAESFGKGICEDCGGEFTKRFKFQTRCPECFVIFRARKREDIQIDTHPPEGRVILS